MVECNQKIAELHFFFLLSRQEFHLLFYKLHFYLERKDAIGTEVMETI